MSSHVPRQYQARVTFFPRTALTRLVEYVEAEVEYDGKVIIIHDAGTGRGMGKDGPIRTNAWGAIAQLLTIATAIEECGGLGLTWEGLSEAMGLEFRRTRDDELILPNSIDATVDAQLCRLANAEKFDGMWEVISAARGGDAQLEIL